MQCRAAANSPRGVLLLGDSITSFDYTGATVALSKRGFLPCVQSQSGSRVVEHLNRLNAGQVPLPPNVIIALGNNDIFRASKFCGSMWSLLWRMGARNVVIPTIWRTRPNPLLPAYQRNATVINRVIYDLARWRTNVQVIDWAGVIRQTPSYQFDGLYLSAAGRALRYRMMADALEALVKARTPAPLPSAEPTPTPTAEPTPTPTAGPTPNAAPTASMD